MNVYLNNTDITDYVSGNDFSLTSSKAEPGQVLINPIPNLIGIDTDGFWNPNNPASVFFGINDYSVFTIQVKDEGILLFEGFILDISRDGNGTAQVALQTKLQKTLAQNIIYSSGGSLNPAEIFMEVCALYKIDWDPVTTLHSSGVYDTDEIVLSADVLVPNTTILAFFETLAQLGIASIYSVGNYLYFSVYEDGRISNPVYTFEDTSGSDEYYILTKPIIQSIQKEIPPGYAITYNDTTLSLEDGVAEFGDQDNAFSLSGGINDLIRIDSLQTAVWIGEQWIEYLSRSDTQVSFEILSTIGRDLLVGYPVRLELADNTIPMNMVINELTVINSVQTQLRGVAYDN